MFAAKLRQVPFTAIFGTLNAGLKEDGQLGVYQKIAAACTLPRARLLVIVAFKYELSQGGGNECIGTPYTLIDQLIYVCTHDYTPLTCIKMLSDTRISGHEFEVQLAVKPSPDERFLAIYTSTHILLYELITLSPLSMKSQDISGSYPTSTSTLLYSYTFLAHVAAGRHRTAGGKSIHVEFIDDIVWSVTKPCLLVLAFSKVYHYVFMLHLNVSGSVERTCSWEIPDSIVELPRELSAISIANITSEDVNARVLCADIGSSHTGREVLSEIGKKIQIVKPTQPTATCSEQIIVCGGYHEETLEDDSSLFTRNFIASYRYVDCTLTKIYFSKLEDRNSIFENVFMNELFPQMPLGVSPWSVAFPFGLHPVDKQVKREFKGFAKSLAVCRLVTRDCFKVHEDTSELPTHPVTMYTGFPIIAASICNVAFADRAASRLSCSFEGDSLLDLERFLQLDPTQLVACADTRGYVHVYLAPQNSHRVFAAKFPILPEKLQWMTSLDEAQDSNRSDTVFTLYIIGSASILNTDNDENDSGEVYISLQSQEVRTIYSLEFSLIDILRFASGKLKRGILEQPATNDDDMNESHLSESHAPSEMNQPLSNIIPPDYFATSNHELEPSVKSSVVHIKDLIRLSRSSRTPRSIPITESSTNFNGFDYSYSSDDSGNYGSPNGSPATRAPPRHREPSSIRTKQESCGITSSKPDCFTSCYVEKVEYSYYDFSSVSDDASLEDTEQDVETTNMWLLSPEEEELADIFGASSNRLIERTNNLLADLKNRQGGCRRELMPAISVPEEGRHSVLNTFSLPQQQTANNLILEGPLETRGSSSYEYPGTQSMESAPPKYLDTFALPSGILKVIRLHPSDRFSPALIVAHNAPADFSILVDASPLGYLPVSGTAFILMLSNGAINLLNCSPKLLLTYTCQSYCLASQVTFILMGFTSIVYPIKLLSAHADDASEVLQHYHASRSGGKENNDISFFLLFYDHQFSRYYIQLFTLSSDQITKQGDIKVSLTHRPDHIYVDDRTVQLAMSNGALFILSISIYAEAENGKHQELRTDATHTLHFTDVNKLTLPVFKLLEANSALLSKDLIHYVIAATYAQGASLMSHAAASPPVSNFDIVLYHAALRSLYKKALEYSIYEYMVTKDKSLVKKLINNIKDSHEEQAFNIFAELVSSDSSLTQRLEELYNAYTD